MIAHHWTSARVVYLCNVTIERGQRTCIYVDFLCLFCRIQVLDYTQYYLNLPEANSKGEANWLVEYSMLEYYDLQEITAITLHDLADRFTQSDDYAFVRWVNGL